MRTAARTPRSDLRAAVLFFHSKKTGIGFSAAKVNSDHSRKYRPAISARFAYGSLPVFFSLLSKKKGIPTKTLEIPCLESSATFSGQHKIQSPLSSRTKGKRLMSNLIIFAMHSKIIQITENRVMSDNILDENTLRQGDYSEYDYCTNITEEVRKEVIDNLVNHILPTGMFKLIGVDEMVYLGGADEFKEKWVNAIHEKAEMVNTENVLDWIGASYQLQKELENPLHTEFQFYLSEDNEQTYADKSQEFMSYVCRLEKGTHLYIGGVIDYHF